VKACHGILAATQPDFAVAMTYDMPWQHSRKRIKKQVDATLGWLDELLKCEESLKESLFGVIQGGGNEEERIRSATQTNQRSVFGFMLSSFNMDEGEEESCKMISTVISHIDETKPRMINTKGDPMSILRDVSNGIDLFCTSFLDTVTNLGCALTWNLPTLNTNDHVPERQHSDQVMILLRGQEFISDPSPLVKGCQCFSCKHHTKAYIYHLLNTHEMLGVTLLQIHNMYHYTLFFEQIRQSIKDGYFEDYKQSFFSNVTK
jgi:queuine tRNA-ribosyltransferase subunit QTRTD1